MMRRITTRPALAIGSTLLWGIIELLALLRSRWGEQEPSHPTHLPDVGSKADIRHFRETP